MGRIMRALRKSQNVFEEPREDGYYGGTTSSYHRGRRNAVYRNDVRGIRDAIFVRLAVDVAQVRFYHAMVDPATLIPQKMVTTSAINERLTVDANIDQSSFALFFDLAMSLFEEGCVALCPVDVGEDTSAGLDILSWRVGRIVAWRPRSVTVEIYDDREVASDGTIVNGGVPKQVNFEKSEIAIIENPFADVMSGINSSISRISRKLDTLDAADEQSTTGNLKIIFKLPFTVRSEKRREQAAKRLEDLTAQLEDNRVGAAWIDASEDVVQLNTPVANALNDDTDRAIEQLYDRMGITAGILNGSATRDEVNNYIDRTIEPLAEVITQELTRKFFSRHARGLGHWVAYFRDPLKLIPLSELAEVVDKLLRNAAITANELRPKLGYFPSSDPRADVLANPNMPADDQITEGVQNAGLPERVPDK